VLTWSIFNPYVTFLYESGSKERKAWNKKVKQAKRDYKQKKIANEEKGTKR
jgi:hypothetical protein